MFSLSVVSIHEISRYHLPHHVYAASSSQQILPSRYSKERHQLFLRRGAYWGDFLWRTTMQELLAVSAILVLFQCNIQCRASPDRMNDYTLKERFKISYAVLIVISSPIPIGTVTDWMLGLLCTWRAYFRIADRKWSG